MTIQTRVRKNCGQIFKDYEDIPKDGKNPNEAKVFELFTRMEQAPNPNSRIILDSEKDELGVPRANLHWDLTELDKRSLRKMYEIFGAAVGKAGIGRVKMYDFLWKANDSEMLNTLVEDGIIWAQPKCTMTLSRA